MVIIINTLISWALCVVLYWDYGGLVDKFALQVEQYGYDPMVAPIAYSNN